MRWASVTLGAISANIQTGPFGSQLHQSDYSDEGIPVVMPKDLVNGHVSEDSIARVSMSHVDRLSRYKIEDGDILYSRRGDVGRCAFATEVEQGWLCGTGCLCVTIDQSKAIPKFVFYQLQKAETIGWVEKHAVGSTMLNLNTTILGSVPIELPSIAEQQVIVNVLSAYDDLIENNQKQIKLLEEAAQRLYKEWFVDLRFPGHETTPIVDGVPEGWSVESMDDIAEYINGYAFKPSDWGTSGKPIIKIKEMGLGVTSDTPRNSGENIPEKYNITAGDILFSWSATLSAMIWDEEDGLLNQHLFKVIPCDGVSREFVLQSILKTLDEFSNLTTGSTMKHIQRGKLKEVHVNVPNERTMRKYKSISEPIREQLLNLKREIILLQEARDRLLPKLMSGEIEVDMLEAPSQIVNVYLPPNFKHKSVNEPFIQKMMELALGRRNWIPGNANKFQPDYFCDGIPFEFTMASDRKDKGNYIQKFYSRKYTTDDVAQDAFQYIQESIQQKLKKTYSVSNVHLCVLCLIDLTDWVLDEYRSVTHCLLDGDRQDFFEWIKSQCIDSKKFNNVFVIFPDMFATWWIWDVLTGHKANIRLSEADILSGQYPFWMNQQSYEELMKLSGNKKW